MCLIDSYISLFDDSVFAEYLSYFFKSFVHLLGGVCSHKREADKSILRGYGRRNYRIYENTFLKEVGSDSECLKVVANEQRYNRSACVTDFTAETAEALESLVGQFPQMLLTLGLFNHDVDCLKSGSRRRGCDAGGENI